MIHPRDKMATNPRLQCVVCGSWMRLHGRTPESKAMQRFFGGCDHNKGNDHLAGKNGDNDVCDQCCQIECKRLAEG